MKKSKFNISDIFIELCAWIIVIMIICFIFYIMINYTPYAMGFMLVLLIALFITIINSGQKELDDES